MNVGKKFKFVDKNLFNIRRVFVLFYLSYVMCSIEVTCTLTLTVLVGTSTLWNFTYLLIFLCNFVLIRFDIET